MRDQQNTARCFFSDRRVERRAPGYYDQSAKRYLECAALDKKLEIASCMGNVSIKDKKIFVHAHVALADHNGSCYGGHLMPGATIFAAEYFLQELAGGDLERVDDPETGLSLWAMEREDREG
ncbi:MAG: DUF296 domain-containing protein [Candidatus Omnitrophota bacterium]